MVGVHMFVHSLIGRATQVVHVAVLGINWLRVGHQTCCKCYSAHGGIAVCFDYFKGLVHHASFVDFATTGAFSGAMALNTFNELTAICPHLISNYNHTITTVRVASGTAIPTCGSFTATFEIANESFCESFLILLSMNQTILILPFFEKDVIVFHPKPRTLNLPHITIQLTERVLKVGKISALTKKPVFENTPIFH